jgi:hypothetical protein
MFGKHKIFVPKKESSKFSSTKKISIRNNQHENQFEIKRFNQVGQDKRLKSMINDLLNQNLKERENMKDLIGTHDVGVSSIDELNNVIKRASQVITPKGINSINRNFTYDESKSKLRTSPTKNTGFKDAPIVNSFSSNPNKTKNSPSIRYKNVESDNEDYSNRPLNKDIQHNINHLEKDKTSEDSSDDKENPKLEILKKLDEKGFNLISNRKRINLKDFKEKSSRNVFRDGSLKSIKSMDSSSKVNQAHSIFNNIKNSINLYEEKVEISKHNYMGLGKEKLMEMYIKKQLESNLDTKTQSGSSLTIKPSESLNGSNRNSLNSCKTKKSNTLKGSRTDDQFRNISKRRRVEDSLSDDDEYFYEQIFYPASFFTIDPKSTFVKYWDLIIILITFYSITFTPYYLAFSEADNSFNVLFLEMFFDIVFIIDILINFFIEFYNYEEELVKNFYLIAMNYLTGWFLVDLLASIPGSTISFILLLTSEDNDSSQFKTITNINKAGRFPKIYKFIKFSKLIKVYKIYKDEQNYANIAGVDELNLSSALQRFLAFVLSFIIISHMLACIWIFIGKSDYPSWLLTLENNHENSLDKSNLEIYITSLYFHWTTIFTIGYGDIISYNTNERIYNSLLMFIGVLIYSFAVSSVGTIITKYDSITEKYYKRIETLEELRIKFNLPRSFYDKIERYLKYDLKFNKNEKYSFINDIPPSVRSELLYDMYKDVIKNFNFFSKRTKDFISRVVFSMRPLRLFKNETLVIEGEYLSEVYFVRNGILSIHLGPKYLDLKIMDVRKNEHFGDALVITKTKSPINLKVTSHLADLLIIRKQDFIEIAKEYPEEFESAIIFSTYNFMVMLDIVNKKKKDIKINSAMRLKTSESVDEKVNKTEKSEPALKRVNSIFNQLDENYDVVITSPNKKEKDNYFEPSDIEKDNDNQNAQKEELLQNLYSNPGKSSNFSK